MNKTVSKHKRHAEISKKHAQNGAMSIHLAIEHKVPHAGWGVAQLILLQKSLMMSPLHQSPLGGLPHVCLRSNHPPLPHTSSIS